MKQSIKLFVTIKLETDTKVVDIDINKPINIIELLKMISDIINFDLLDKLITDNTVKSDVIILIDGKNINNLNKLDTIIKKDAVISITSP